MKARDATDKTLHDIASFEPVKLYDKLCSTCSFLSEGNILPGELTADYCNFWKIPFYSRRFHLKKCKHYERKEI